jgi:hypothetical protein
MGYQNNGQMIKAYIIQDSICNGKRITSFELEYPRFIHSEIMTHRVFSRNAASSRAIPIERMIELVKENAVYPYWTANQAGMQGDKVTDPQQVGQAKHIWGKARVAAIEASQALCDLGIHKQNANRLLEPFQTMKTIVTATEWDNFFELRCHKDAQPEFQELARAMRGQQTMSKPLVLKEGDWHVPYVGREHINGETKYFDNAGYMSEQHALAISASCCAQVSYRRLDATRAKALEIFDRLATARPIHASPFEHQAMAMANSHKPYANFVGWKQYRASLENIVHAEEVAAAH